MTTPRYSLVWLALPFAVLFAVFAYLLDRSRDRLAAEFDARARVERIAERRSVADTIYRVDTLRLTETKTVAARARVVYVNARDSALARVEPAGCGCDSTIAEITDRADRALSASDSVIAAGARAVRTAETRVALADSLGDARLDLARRSMQRDASARSKRSFKLGVALGVAGTAGVVALLK